MLKFQVRFIQQWYSIPMASIRLYYLFLLLTAGSLLNAQSSTGSIFGTVTDPSGAVVPGATVTARWQGAVWERQTVTGERGEFRLVGLIPGYWDLLVEAPGFRGSRSRIFLDVNQHFRHDIELQLGVTSSIGTPSGR